MRVINFRGKRVDNGEQVYGDVHFNIDCTKCHIHGRSKEVFESHYVIPETVKIEVCGQWFDEKELADVVKKGLRRCMKNKT